MSTSVRAVQPSDLQDYATGEMVDPLVRLVNGKRAPGLTATGVNEANEYAVDAENSGTGTKSFRAVAGAAYARVENGTVLLGGPTTLDGSLLVTGRLTLGEYLRFTATDARIIAGPTSLQIRNAADSANNIHIADGGAVTLRNLLTVSAGGAAITGDSTVTGGLTVTNNLAAGDATTDAHTLIGSVTARSTTGTETALFVDTTTTAQVVRMGPAATPSVTVAPSTRLVTFGATGIAAVQYIDIPNNRVIMGGSTALSSATDDKLSVVGGALHIASATADTALGIRHTTTGETWLIGATAATNPDLIFKESGTEIVRFGALGATYLLDVNGDARVDGDLDVTGALTAGTISFTDLSVTDAIDAARAVFGAAAFSGTEELRVVGQTRLEGATEVTTGGLTVTGGVIADTHTVNGTGTVMLLNGTSQTQTTVGAAGGASALPATPSGYIKITVGGTDFCFPYYARS